MPLLWLRSLHSARRMKLPNDCFEIRNSLCGSLAFSVDPTIMPSRTLQKRGSPDQPSRFLPLNSGRKPSWAKAANEHSTSRRASLLTASLPFDLERPDLHIFFGPVLRAARHVRNLFDHVVSLDDFPENTVLVVEPGRRGHSDEELAAVGIRPGIGHGQQAGFGVLQLGMKLIGELVARTAAARSFGAAALNHEIRYDAMKDEAVVERLAGFGSLGERDKILHGLGHAVGEKPCFEAALGGIENGVNFFRHEGDCSSRRGAGV